ncbi:hypothetical protein [Lachnoclostridium phytofermentans]|uniref:hypothetical protein n=1 Tax=Lachnoclostridium phytofermentans TaxID=66219 RepID=UPI0004972269|nr:hypothetical protein [Lachnoclostridium phytofermentans]
MRKKYIILLMFLFIFSACESINNTNSKNEVGKGTLGEPLINDNKPPSEYTNSTEYPIPTESPAPTRYPTPTIIDTSKEQNIESTNLQDIYQEMISNKTYTVNSDTDKEKFEIIWNLIKGHWYSNNFIQMINDKTLFSNHYLELFVDKYDSEDSISKNYYAMTEFDYMVGDGILATSFHIKPENKIIYIYGKYDEINEEDLYYELDISLSKIKTPLGSRSFTNINMDINDYINEKVLVGNYHDQNGKEYTFQSNRTATWGDKQFRYNTFVMGYWPYCNPIIVVDEYDVPTGEEYGYIVKDESIYLYGIVYDKDDVPNISNDSIAILN